nr:hypothetical protein [Legionella busanensis]
MLIPLHSLTPLQTASIIPALPPQTTIKPNLAKSLPISKAI